MVVAGVSEFLDLGQLTLAFFGGYRLDGTAVCCLFGARGGQAYPRLYPRPAPHHELGF